jgi:hypothetical protein
MQLFGMGWAAVLGAVVGSLLWPFLFSRLMLFALRMRLAGPLLLLVAHGMSWVLCVALCSFGWDQYPAWRVILPLALGQIIVLAYDLYGIKRRHTP